MTLTAGGVNVAVYSAHAEAVDLCLFDQDGNREVERISLPERTGDVFHAHVAGVEEGTRYGLRAHGPYTPHEGHRFNAAKLLVDPYALELDRPFRLDPTMWGYVAGDGRRDETDSAAVMPKGIVVAPVLADPWDGAPQWSRTVITELHVRGFTKRHPGVPEAARGTFAGLAAPAALDHLVKLGVTAVELMPAAAWVDERHLPPLGLTNYWGYNPIAFSAPDPRLAPGGWAEVRAATAALNRAGIEVILDVVYNHSGESDEWGPTLSLRGLDNASYYRLLPEDPSRYINDAGCGNILAADRTPVVRLVLDALRNWVRYGGVNGFRFDLATTLGRRMGGFEPNAPLLAAIEQDPVLRGVRLIAEAWDIGPGGYQVGRFDAAWGEWNDHFRDDARRFWRGDVPPAALAGRVTGSSDLFAAKRRPSRGINYVSAHDGFTLADVVAYTDKRNQPNGEDNRDGAGANWSWNGGAEGPTDNPAIRAGRLRDQKNLLATLLLARGTPMLGPGTERCLTQNGNNNAYAQDNESTWVDWSGSDDLTGFIARLIAVRLGNPAFTHDRFLTGQVSDGADVPDVAWRRPDGAAPQASDWEHPATRTLIAVLDAPAGGGLPDNRVVVITHAGFDALPVVLPAARAGCGWRVAIDTADDRPAVDSRFAGGATLTVQSRSVVALVEQLFENEMRAGLASDQLDQLARAAGIAPEWFEMNGACHVVTPETKAALLAGMGLAVGSPGEIRDSQDELVGRRELRALPETAIAWDEVAPVLAIAAVDRPSASADLVIEREDGSTVRVRFDRDAANRVAGVTSDGRPAPTLQIQLPVQPIGRHRVWLADDPSTSCALTVAPPRCFLPETLLAGRKAFGVAAHLYTLRSAADQGIGDFTTLARFADAAGHHGAKLVGLNPLHAMFPEHRDQASPYYPSDRRFIDPIYIDVTAPVVVGEAPDVQRALDRQTDRIAALRGLANVDYERVWALKKEVLAHAFASFEARRRAGGSDPDLDAFAAFVRAGGTPLADYAVFAAASDEFGGTPWWTWPEGLRHPDDPGVRAYAEAKPERFFFQLYLQWLADLQLGAAAAAGQAAGLRFGFYRDLAVGTAQHGAESWANQGTYATGMSVGAPPDAFSASGQTWGLPPPNPVAPGRAWLDTFARLVAANMRHAGALRIDHAMGLSRLFCIPHGMPGAAGAYVHYPFEAMLGELALESQRARCLVIGEDLGTVAPGFRERLAAADILSYRVLFFEREHGLSFIPADRYPAKAVACVSTHDLPTLAGWWQGAEIAERRALGSFTAAEAERAETDRAVERTRLAEALGRPDLAGAAEAGAEIVGEVHRFVAAAPSMLVMAQADDLVGETVAVNLPGTSGERPNWRRRLAPDVDELFDLPLARQSLPVRGGDSEV